MHLHHRWALAATAYTPYTSQLRRVSSAMADSAIAICIAVAAIGAAFGALALAGI
jgi:hypothetical protein